MPNKGRRVSMRIVHRHHFSSALKRMSAIVSLQSPGSSTNEYIVTVKGAPETLRSMVRGLSKNILHFFPGGGSKHREKSSCHVAMVAKFLDLKEAVVLKIWQEKKRKK